MTRETKIGLFVGMGVIILIGILISDHLSVAQRQHQPDFGGAFPEARDTRLTEAEKVNASLPVSERPVPSPGQLTTGKRADASKPQPAHASNEGADTIRQDVRRAIAEIPDHKPRAGGESKMVITPGRRTATDQGRFEVVPDQGLTAEQIQKIPGVAGAPGPTVHTVQEGQTLSEIARHYYGKGGDWRRIFQANKAVLSSPEDLAPGMKLQIPGVPGGALGTPKAEVAGAPKGVQGSSEYAEYTLKEGETLAQLAQKFYGSQAKWHDLYELNRDRIKDPDRLSPGLTLRVPRK